MKQALFRFAPILVCAVSCFAQEIGTASPHHYVSRPYKATAHAAVRPTLSIPAWSTTAGSYTYQMVGQSPFTSTSGATTIPAPIVPVILTFSDGSVFDPTAVDKVCSATGSATALMTASPLFNKSTFSVGGSATESDTYIDYFQRANFWQYVGTNANYHINLTPSVTAPLKLTVPSASGKTSTPTGGSACSKTGLVDINWLDAQLTGAGFQTAGVSALALPLFTLYNVVMYDTTASNCCILGYHSVANSGSAIQTYAVGEFDATGNFGSTTDIAAFSHEIGEWLDDPLGSNSTPAWGNTGQVSGCQSDLEVGDPLSGTEKTISLNSFTYHVQELAFVSWFYGQKPSSGLNGWYSSFGKFQSPANACYVTKTTLSLTPASIPAGGSTSVNITVAPTSGTGTPTGKVNLVSGNTGKTLTTYTLSSGAVTNANLSGLATGSDKLTADYLGDGTYSPSNSSAVTITVGAAAVTFSPVSLSFGSQTVGTATAAQSVKLTNGGTAALTGVSISITGASAGDYSETNTCGSSVAAAASCTISVIFKPTATGTRTASISVADSASGSPQTVALSGTGASTGTGSITLSATSLAFGSENLGSSRAAQTVTVSNTGTASTKLSVSLGGANAADFPLTSTCGQNLAAGATCKLTVTFTPLATGALSATLSVSGKTVSLSGTGVSTGTLAAKLSTTSLSFGNVSQGVTSASQTVTLTNTGTGALSIASMSIGGANARNFGGTTTCPTILGAGANCTISIYFRPAQTGALSATLSISDNAATSPQTVALTGTGTVAVTSNRGH